LIELSASLISGEAVSSFYKSVRELLAQYAALNPHATFTLSGAGDPETFAARKLDWKKWTPDKPPSAHWYNPEQFIRLITAYLADDRTSGRRTTVREFLASFAGMKSSQMQKDIAAQAGLSLSRLESLMSGDEIDAQRAQMLLSLMVKNTKPVAPEHLGLMNRNLVQSAFGPWDIPPASVAHRCVRGFFDNTTLPAVLEMGFAPADDPYDPSHVIFGMNFSPALTLPDTTFRYAMQDNLIDYNDAVKILVSVTYPDIRFTDLGKGQLELPQGVQDQLAGMLTDIAKPWRKWKEKWRREQRAEERRAYAQPAEERGMSFKEAAEQVMEAAYMKASGGGQYPANARQIYYAARPQILALTGKDKLDDQYFTQSLLPDFLNERPGLKASWNVVYDARGHFSEPHGGEALGIGTQEVREYVAKWRRDAPENTYGAVLFIEKEGFDALLDQARIASEYDLAIMSTKGFTVTAARELIEALTARQQGIKILALHDFDFSGLGIYHTLWNDTRRHAFDTRPVVKDLGLRLEDVVRLGLENEPCLVKGDKDPRERLREYGATEDECDFLVRRRTSGGWAGERVELNALTSDQFVDWLREKLDLHGVKKVIPEESVLAAQYREAVREAYITKKVEEARRTQPSDDEIDVPADLAEQGKNLLEEGRRLPWRFVVSGMAADNPAAEPFR
jgi:hypothetical protein